MRGWATANQNLILHTTDGGWVWEAQNPGLPFHYLPRIVFVDSLRGWALGNYGQVIYTTDGGRAWQEQKRMTDGLVAMAFVDSTHGWIAGKEGKILAVDFDLQPAATTLDKDDTPLACAPRNPV